MALKDLYNVIKADRYTADGREAIIKAQEAETEDKVYQIGEISQKTGLQKTAQGWKPPKETKFGKVKQNKEGQWGVQTKQGKGSDFLKHKSEKEASRALANYTAGYNTTERSKQDPHSDYARQQKQWNKEVDRMRKNSNAERRAEHASHFQENNVESKPSLSHKDHVSLAKEVKSNSLPGSDWTAEEIAKEWKLGKGDAEEVKKEFDNLRKSSSGNKPAAEKTDGFDYRSSMEKDPRSAASFKGAVSHSIPMNQTDRDELEGLSKFMSEEKATYQNALKNRAQALVDGHKGNGDWFPEKEKAIMKIAKAVGFDDELHKFIAEENRGYDLGYSEDAAPRTLTGDTRIRVRKS